MKKKILIVSAIIICLAVTVSSTLAYFTSEDIAHNIITSGSVKIEVIEKMLDENGTLKDFPKEGVNGVMPGADVSKIVSVKNIGEGEAWIRVRVKAVIKAQDETLLPNEIKGVGNVMTYNISNEWILGEDGYYYYKHPLPVGEVTDILFDKVSFSSKMGNEYQKATANILVSAQAVQIAHNGASVMEAQGWPLEK